MVVARVGVAAAAVGVAAADGHVVVAGDRLDAVQEGPDGVAVGAEAAEVAQAVEALGAAGPGIIHKGAQRVGVGVDTAAGRDPHSLEHNVMRSDSDHAPPRLAILGAGPTGLEAALAAAARGWPFTVYERAAAAGGHVRAWGHVRLFTPWSMNVSPAARAALGAAAPEGPGLPTGAELADHLLDPLAARLGRRLRTGAHVVAVGRDGLLKHEGIGSPARARRPFRLLVRDAGDGSERIERADVVLDATGTYGNPNALGDGGIPAPGEGAAAAQIRRELPDLAREAAGWAGKRILLTGAGHSAQTAARALAGLARDAPATRVHWAVRSPAPDWSAVPGDPLPERARLSATTRALAAGSSAAVAVDAGAVTEALAPAGDGGGRLRVTLRGGGGGGGGGERSRSTGSSPSTAASATSRSTASSRSRSATRPAGRSTWPRPCSVRRAATA